MVTIEIPPARNLDADENRAINNGALVVLRGMQCNSVHAYTEMYDNQSIYAMDISSNDTYTGICDGCGMHKPTNRMGNAFVWPHVRYREIKSLDDLNEG